jgi:hypothetical protein
MKDYAERKKNKKWSAKKVVTVVSPAVTEVKDENDVVVRAKKDEVTREELSLSKKRWDAETGKALDDNVQTYTIENIDSQIASCDSRIADAQADKDGWELFKADLQALK